MRTSGPTYVAVQANVGTLATARRELVVIRCMAGWTFLLPAHHLLTSSALFGSTSRLGTRILED